MISKGELKGKVWRFLNKTERNPGFYTSEKMDDAIEEAMTCIAVDMFLAGEGWLTKYIFLDTAAGQTSIDVPGNVALIREVRYKRGDIYYPLIYNDQEKQGSYIGSGVTQSTGFSYRLLGKQIVFDPPIGEGGARFLQIECVYFPETVVGENELIDPQYDLVAVQYLKYKIASILASSIEKNIISWTGLEIEWNMKLKSILDRRVMSSTSIREFL